MTEPADLPTLLEISAEIAWPDTNAEAATHARLHAAGLADGALGRLADLATWLSGVQGVCPPREPRRPRLVVFRAGGSGGGDVAAVFADVAAVGLRVVDLSAGTSTAATPISATSTAATSTSTSATSTVATSTSTSATATVDTSTPDISAAGRVVDAAAVDALIRAGARVADEEIDAGADLLVVGATGRAGPVADAVVSIMTLVEPVKVVGLSTTLSDAEWMTWVADVRDTRLRGLPHRHDVAELLATVGGPEMAALTGFLLRAAARRTPVLFDGVAAAAAVLLAREAAPNVVRWCLPGARSTRPAHDLALAEFAAVPVLDLAFGVDDGIGSVLAVPLLRAAARAVTDLTVTEPAGEPAGEPATESAT